MKQVERKPGRFSFLRGTGLWIACILTFVSCFKSEIPPGMQMQIPEKDTFIAVFTDGDSNGHLQLANDVTSDAAQTPKDATEELADASGTQHDAVEEDAITDIAVEVVPDQIATQDSSEKDSSVEDGSKSDTPEEIVEGYDIWDATSGDCPTCEGAPFPEWSLEDFQPASAKFGEIYGLTSFKGRIVVLALLAGW